MSDTTDRLTDIELTLAHQEQTLHDLNDMVTRQWDLIDVLTCRLERQEDMIKRIDMKDGTNADDEPPPPHY